MNSRLTLLCTATVLALSVLPASADVTTTSPGKGSSRR